MGGSLWWRGCARLASISCSAAQSNKTLFAFSAGFLLLLIFYSGSVPRLSITEKHYHYHLVKQKDRDIMMNNKTIFKVSQQSGVYDYSFPTEGSTNAMYLKLNNTSGNKVKNTVIKSGETMNIKVDTTGNTAANYSTTTSETRKTIVFNTKFFSGSWEDFLAERTLLPPTCPVTNCDVLFNTSHLEDADAIIFHGQDINYESLPKLRRRGQLYIWLNMEAPRTDNNNVPHRLTRQFKIVRKMVEQEDRRLFGFPGFFNWTFTYHRDSDLLLLYGGLWPLQGEGNVVQPGLLNTSGTTYKNYVAALYRGDRLQDDKQQEWSTFLTRPKLVVWMASHCSTSSGREFYVRNLQKHLQVDVFGACGDLKCGKSHHDVECYSRLLRPNYKFYLAFENNLCEDYITEKVWLPMHYGLVPVVYGGARYADFLPPHSYVDATHLTPLQLSRLLSRVGGSPELYERYHLWRKYWRVLLKPPMCELCYKLHLRTHEEAAVGRQRQYRDLRAWWWRVNNCTTQYPPDRYPRDPEPDSRPLMQKLMDVFGFLKWAGRSAASALPSIRRGSRL